MFQRSLLVLLLSVTPNSLGRAADGAAGSIGAAASSAQLFADAPSLPDYAFVRPDLELRFPADHGAHPEFRTEWWYITGWLETEDGAALGFQVTFFRSRPSVDQRNPSAFAAKQILFAHAALSDPLAGRILHDQRAARAGLGLAEFSVADTDIVLNDWSLQRQADGSFHAEVAAGQFAFELSFTPTQSVLLQGDGGYSRKGPLAPQASHYYSLPHLEVAGTVQQGGHSKAVTGSGWLDHEWSSTLLDPDAVGWDWVGLNLEDGSALTAFRIRDAAGATIWSGGSLRGPDGEHIRLERDDVLFTPRRHWRSPRTNADYPVETVLTVRVAGRDRQWHIQPLFDDQELDSRAAGGPVYWEGAVEVEGGRGYLELTGYERPLRM